VYVTFRYHVVRVWEQPVESVLACGLTVLPLAPVSRVAPADVPAVLLAISGRLEREATPEQAAALWNATKILMGLRYSTEQIDSIVEGVSAMLYGIRGIEASSVYQAILHKGEAKGAVEEARAILLRQGRKKLGPPGAGVEATIAAIADRDRLHDLIERVLDVDTWDELLAPSDPSA